MFPQATIPCVQLSLLTGLDPTAHVRVGKSLVPLREEGVMIIGSGMSFHNMRVLLSGRHDAVDSQSEEFDQWLNETLCAEMEEVEREARLIDWLQAPGARYCHPREEHLLPLHVCYGAADKANARRIFNSPLMGARVSAYEWS